MSDELPPNSGKNTPEHVKLLERVSIAARDAGGKDIHAVAVVIVTKDGLITTGIATAELELDGIATAFAKLQHYGPESLRITIERMLKGKGTTRVIRRSDT